MTNKAFSILLLITLILGGGLGAAFAAGVALGKSQGPDPSQESSAFQTPRSSQGSGFQSGGFQGGGGFRQSADGQAGDFQGRPPGGGEGGFADHTGEPPAAAEGGPDHGGDGGLVVEEVEITVLIATVEQVQHNMVTLTSFQGPVQVILQEETIILKTVEGVLADLVEGANVRINGRPDEEGNLQARSITLLPDDFEDVGSGFGGPGGFARAAPLTGKIVSVEEGIMTVSGPDGPVEVVLQAETAIQKTVEGTEADLVEGIQVRVVGTPGEAGTILAQSLTVVPADASGFFGRRGGRGSQ